MQGKNRHNPGDEFTLQYARALIELGRPWKADEQFRTLIDSQEPGDTRADLSSELALALERFGLQSEAHQLLVQALAECHDPILLRGLENQIASCLQALGKGAEAASRMKLSPNLAAALTNPRIVARLSMTTASLLANQLRLREAAGEYERAAEFGLQAEDLPLVAWARHCASRSYLQMGAFAEWQRFSDGALAIAERCPALLTLVEIHGLRALVHQMRGDAEQTYSETDAGLAILANVEQPTGEALYLITPGWQMRAWLGDLTVWHQLDAEVRRAEFPHPSANEPARWIALIKLDIFRGLQKEARLNLKQALRHVPPGPRDANQVNSWAPGAFNVADCVADVGDGQEALVRYKHLKPFASLLLPHVLPPLVLGRLASLIGLRDEAKGWLLDARELATRAGLTPYEAMADFELGLLYERMHEPTQAVPYFQNAACSFQKLGMRYFYQAQAQKRLEAALSACNASPLTSRNAEYFRLWGLGWKMKKIARELGVSLDAVKSQIQTCYRKTKTRGKGQAAVWCRENGLINPEDVGRSEESEDTPH